MSRPTALDGHASTLFKPVDAPSPARDTRHRLERTPCGWNERAAARRHALPTPACPETPVKNPAGTILALATALGLAACAVPAEPAARTGSAAQDTPARATPPAHVNPPDTGSGY